MSFRIPVLLWLWLPIGTVPPIGGAKTLVLEPATASCTARELWRRRLVVEGDRELYLESRVLAASGARSLLAGEPSYIFHKRAPGAMAELEGRDIVFGAVIEADGSARTLPAPPVNQGRTAAIAALASEDGGWRVIFAERESTDGGSDNISAAWHAIYDGTRWSAIEQLPVPAGTTLRYFNSSRLVQSGDTVMWAAVARTGGGPQGVALFERTAGAWSHSIPATPFSSGVELVHTPRLGFVLSVRNSKGIAGIGPTGIPVSNTFFFYPRSLGWQLHRKIDMGEDPTIVGGKLHSYGETAAATWFGRTEGAGSRLELRAMVGAIFDRDEPLVTLEADAAPEFAPVLGDGEVAWITHHWTGGDSTDTGELRLVRMADGKPEVLWRTIQPYLGGPSATYSGSDVLIVGPQLDRELELLVSLIIRVRIHCEGTRTSGN